MKTSVHAQTGGGTMGFSTTPTRYSLHVSMSTNIFIVVFCVQAARTRRARYAAAMIVIIYVYLSARTKNNVTTRCARRTDIRTYVPNHARDSYLWKNGVCGRCVFAVVGFPFSFVRCARTRGARLNIFFREHHNDTRSLNVPSEQYRVRNYKKRYDKTEKPPFSSRIRSNFQ